MLGKQYIRSLNYC